MICWNGVAALILNLKADESAGIQPDGSFKILDLKPKDDRNSLLIQELLFDLQDLQN